MESEMDIGGIPLKRGLAASSGLLAVLITQATAGQAIETLSEQLDTSDPVFRALLQAVAPGLIGLLLVGSAGESDIRRGIGIGLAATAAKNGLEQPVKKVVRLALEREATTADEELAMIEPPHKRQRWSGRAQRRPSYLEHERIEL